MTTHPVIDHLAKDERIRAIAYAIWEEEGRPEGQAEAHWLRACEIVEAEAVEPEWLKRTVEEAPKSIEQIIERRKIA